MNRILLAIAFILCAFTARAETVTHEVEATSGTAVATTTFSQNWKTGGPSGIYTLSVAWTSDASGNVVIVLPRIEGIIAKVVTDPGATAPSANYDILLNDTDGLDVLAGGGANRHTSTTEAFTPLISTTQPSVVCGATTLAITNAGDSKVGTFKLYVRRQ